MFDATLRRRLDRPLTSMAKALDRRWITPNRLTMLGLAAGIASAISAGFQLWLIGVILWLVSRLADGLDGALARVRRKQGRLPESGAGGFLDITADFVVYGATVFGVGIGTGVEFDSPWWPFFAVLLAYYVNGGAFLAFSSIAEKTGRTIDDGRSLSFFGRVAEATETIVIHTVWLLLPSVAWMIAIVWAIFVGLSATQRIIAGYRALT
ncbi:MAG: CDP-alcohol phosphatidyltransferase family protein [Microbacteriaceae bacterium]|nr:MAG: CDP-alcohol phosphatidyltransferase family protein [Microbacteriaceae bacterium]